MLLTAVVGLIAGIIVGWISRGSPTVVTHDQQLDGASVFSTPVPTVRLKSGAQPTIETVLAAEGITVGRAGEEATFVIRDADEVVSRRHCSIRWDPTERAYVVQDDGSKNGTVVEGRVLCLPEQRVLALPGSVVFVGGPGVQLQLSYMPGP